MRVLVLGHLDGRLERLQAVLETTRMTGVGAIFVLGNIVAIEARQHTYAAQVHAGMLPTEFAATVAREDAVNIATYTRAVEFLGVPGIPVYLIPGEQDVPLTALSQVLQAYRGSASMHLVHRTAAYLGDGDVVAGFGGRLTTAQGDDQSLLCFPAWEVRVAFEYLASFSTLFQSARRRILLFATPPQGERVDRRDGEHVGVRLLNWMIRVYQPHLVCCGGSESGRGVERIEGAPVVDPGALAAGSYALVDLDRLSVQLERLSQSPTAE